MSKKVVTMISLLAFIFAFTVACTGKNDNVNRASGKSESNTLSSTDGKNDANLASGKSESGMLSSADGKSITSMSKVELVGKEVIDSQGNKIGQISDVSIDPQTNDVRFALISTDNGSKLVPVPTDSVTFNESRNSLVLNMSKERFEQAPMYNRNEVPNITDRTKYDETYRYFGVSPRWMEGTEGGMGTERRGPERSGSSGVR